MLSAGVLTPLLAGTQCTQCGYPSCAAYAEALATEHSIPTTLCRPGGARVAQALATALNQTYAPPAEIPLPPQVAFITESDCIGCTLCQQKCPTSAIVGAPKQLHTILTSLCDGCNLCVPVCPTQCIILQPAPPKHALTQHLPNGSLTESASQQTWLLVNATAARHSKGVLLSNYESRVTNHEAQPLQPLDAALSAKIAAARTKSEAKFAAKGPIRRPRALKK